MIPIDKVREIISKHKLLEMNYHLIKLIKKLRKNFERILRSNEILSNAKQYLAPKKRKRIKKY